MNDELRTALTASEHDPDSLADACEVDVKTVRRWLEGRIPHPRHRSTAARALCRDELDLWPSTRRPQRSSLDEIIGAYARRSDPGAPDWRGLVRGAQRQIDLLGYSLLHVAETRGIVKLLSDKVGAGVPVRVAIVDPTAACAIAADATLRPPGRLIERITKSRARLLPLVDTGVQVREHQVAAAHTIIRADDELLLTVHLHATPAFQAPLLHVRRHADYQLFDQLAGHFEAVWAGARPLGSAKPATSHEPAEPSPDSPAPDPFLDQLDYVWRPDTPSR